MAAGRTFLFSGKQLQNDTVVTDILPTGCIGWQIPSRVGVMTIDRKLTPNINNKTKKDVI